MPSLAELYNRRQPSRRDSNSTVASSEAESIAKLQRETSDASLDKVNLEHYAGLVFNWCNQIRIGNKVTNEHHYNYFVQVMYLWKYCLALRWNVLLLTDIKNPAFILKNERIAMETKIQFMVRQKWFWFLLALLVILIISPYIMLMLMTTQSESFEVNRRSWGAKDSKEDLVILQSPISKILVTHTNDANESCSTFVRPPTK